MKKLIAVLVLAFSVGAAWGQPQRYADVWMSLSSEDQQLAVLSMLSAFRVTKDQIVDKFEGNTSASSIALTRLLDAAWGTPERISLLPAAISEVYKDYPDADLASALIIAIQNVSGARLFKL